MLGLGDIVIPGIFVALLLRYDQSLKRNSNFYFYATFIAYFLGLCGTIVVMHVFKHAQPALLYLVPACLGTPIFMALIRGDIKSMFSYADHPDEDTEEDLEVDLAGIQPPSQQSLLVPSKTSPPSFSTLSKPWQGQHTWHRKSRCQHC